jgi:nucleotide-binding universal stress UspA family protein
MSTRTTAPRPVAVGYEDHHSQAAMDWAAQEALRLGAALRVVHSYAPESSYPWGYGQPLPAGEIARVGAATKEEATRILGEAADRVRERNPDLDVIETLARSSAARALVEASGQCSTLVIGRRPRHHWSPALGSVSLPVAAHAACPVVVVPGQSEEASDPHTDADGFEPLAAGQVVLGLEDSAECVDAAGFAFAQASARRAGLTAVHAWWVDPALSIPLVTDWDEVADAHSLLTDALLAPWRNRYPDVHVTRVLARARASTALVAAAVGAELLVVGSRGRGGFTSLLLGSVSRNVLAHAPCPVAVVHKGQLSDVDALPLDGGD